MDPGTLALALTSSLSAGLNLYLTVLVIGVMGRLEWVALPPGMEFLSDSWLLAITGVLFLIEFVTDKIPYIDNVWDSFHTFVRVPAGALLAAGALGWADVPEQWVWVAGLLGGFVTLTSHGAKATARLAVNSTPEPFTNWFLSLFEDGLVVAVLWLMATHPWIALALGMVLLLLFGVLIYLFFRLFKAILRPRRPRPAGP